MPLLDKLRKLYGVGPVCSELHIAPSTYYHCQQQRHHPDKRSARAQWICPYISRHLLSLNPLLACCRRYSRGER